MDRGRDRLASQRHIATLSIAENFSGLRSDAPITRTALYLRPVPDDGDDLQNSGERRARQVLRFSEEAKGHKAAAAGVNLHSGRNPMPGA